MSADESAPAEVLAGKRSSFRVIKGPYQGYQDKRRRDALLRQKAARLRSANRARNLVLEEDQQQDERLDELPPCGQESVENASAEDADMEASASCTGDQGAGGRRQGSRSSGNSNRRRQQQRQQQQPGAGGFRAFGARYGNELMQPEWMTDVPSDLARNWLVMPRPEGMRCLLVTARGRTVSWLRNGAPLHRFHSPLPGGSPATAGGCGAAAATAAAGDYCILDCVFHPPNNTYYIQDLLCWRGYALYDCTAEFRAFWLLSKLQEEGLAAPGGLACSGAGPGPDSAAMTATRAPPPVSPLVAQQEEPMPEQQQQQQQQPGHEGQRRWCRGRGGRGGGRGGGGDADIEMGDDDGSGTGCQEQPQAAVSYRIVPLSVRPCTLQGLREAYGSGDPHAAGACAANGADPWVGGGPPMAAPSDPVASAAAERAGADVDFLRDGLYFLHREGHYIPGPAASPLALLWKDLGCSRYLVDTDAKGLPLEHQLVVLAYRSDRTVATEDEPPVVLGRLPEAFSAAMGDKLKPGRLLRFSIRQGGITFHEGRPAGADLHYEGVANQRRGRADTFSKILFQRLARTAPITAALLAAAAAVEAAPAAAEADTEFTDATAMTVAPAGAAGGGGERVT